MLEQILNIEEGHSVISMELLFRGGWPLLAALLVASCLYTIYLYRSEKKISARYRVLLGSCHLLALTVLVIVIAEPFAKIGIAKPYRQTMLVLVDTSRSMSVEDARVSVEDIEEAAKILGRIPLDKKLTPQLVSQYTKAATETSRLELVQALISHPQVDLLRKLNERFDVRFFSFDDQLAPEGGPADDPVAWLKDRKADGESSQIGGAIREAVSRYAGQSIAGVMVFSDFAWVHGEDPARIAADFKKRDIPIYTFALGLESPPDIIVNQVIAPEVVFKDDTVPMRIQIESHGLAGRNVMVNMTIDGEREKSQEVTLEEGVQYVEMVFAPDDEFGTLKFDFTIDPLEGETNVKNNVQSHHVRIINEKIKVLYIEGSPRWEYRYLRWVLLRDPRLKTTFLMTQGDPALAKISRHYIASFPKNAQDIFQYDLIILGDVASRYFDARQLAVMEEQIKTHGGSLLMLAGPVGAPASYRNTPVEMMLPVNLGIGRAQPVPSKDFPVVTAAGLKSSVTTLVDSQQSNERIWSKVRPLYRVPNLEGAKAGATVLLTLPKLNDQQPDYPLVAWHNYGKGKSMFVGTEDLWRMRLEVGDEHHARFWSQAIQFLTLSRLLGQNKQISLQTTRKSYSGGEQIRIYANVLSDSYEPVIKPSHKVIIERKGFPDTAKVVELTPDPDVPGLYVGSQLSGEDGPYILRAQAHEAGVANEVEFHVATEAMEDRDTTMHPQIAEDISNLSGGKTLSVASLANFTDSLGDPEKLTKIVRSEMDLWDTPVLYVLLLLFACLEWFLRRKENLA